MKKKILLIPLAIFLAVSLVAISCAAPAPPKVETAADFYANNLVEIAVPFKAGGGSDYASRLFASYWSEVVPGGTMVVKNRPGGAGVVCANYVYEAKPDGLTLFGGINPGTCVIGPVFFEDPAVRFELAKFGWIGVIDGAPFALGVGANSPYESVEDLQKAEGIKFGGQAPKGGPATGAALAIDLLGLKDAHVVLGYGGGPETALAAAKGEVDCMVWETFVWLDEMAKGTLKKPLAIMDFERSDWFPDLPPIVELATLSPEQEKLLRLYTSIYWVPKAFGTTPGVPKDRLEFLRDAFDKIVATNAFVRQAKLRWPIWPEPISGKELQNKMSTLEVPSKEDIARFNQLEKYMK